VHNEAWARATVHTFRIKTFYSLSACVMAAENHSVYFVTDVRRFTLLGNSSSRFRLADTMPKLADLGIARDSWAIVTVPGALRRDEDATILQCIKASFLPRLGDGL